MDLDIRRERPLNWIIHPEKFVLKQISEPLSLNPRRERMQNNNENMFTFL